MQKMEMKNFPEKKRKVNANFWKEKKNERHVCVENDRTIEFEFKLIETKMLGSAVWSLNSYAAW